MNIPFGVAGVLTIIFVVLKLLGVIAWSWFWVLSPVWISVLIWVVLAILASTGLMKIFKR